MPRWPEKTDATEQKVGQDTHLDISTTAKLEDVKRTDLIVDTEEVVIVKGDGLDNSYAAQIAFLEEPVDVMIHDSTEANAEPFPCVAVNGVNQFFPRGQAITVKRKFLAALARAKTTSVSTKVVNNDGEVYNRLNKHTALRYPFSVVRDSNPKGSAWLKAVLAEA